MSERNAPKARSGAPGVPRHRGALAVTVSLKPPPGSPRDQGQHRIGGCCQAPGDPLGNPPPNRPRALWAGESLPGEGAATELSGGCLTRADLATSLQQQRGWPPAIRLSWRLGWGMGSLPCDHHRVPSPKLPGSPVIRGAPQLPGASDLQQVAGNTMLGSPSRTGTREGQQQSQAETSSQGPSGLARGPTPTPKPAS